MLNLLNDISNSGFRIQTLRANIAELTEDLHREEMKVVAYAQQCIGIRNEELEEQKRTKG